MTFTYSYPCQLSFQSSSFLVLETPELLLKILELNHLLPCFGGLAGLALRSRRRVAADWFHAFCVERAEEPNLSPIHNSAVLEMSPVECHEVVLDNGNTLAVELEVCVWVGVEEYEGHDVVCGYGRPSPCLEVVDVLVRRARDSRQGKDTARLGCLTPCVGTAEDSELDRRDVARCARRRGLLSGGCTRPRKLRPLPGRGASGSPCSGVHLVSRRCRADAARRRRGQAGLRRRVSRAPRPSYTRTRRWQ